MKNDWQLETYLVKLLKLSQEFGMIPVVDQVSNNLVIKDFNKDLASKLLLADDQRSEE